MTEIDVYFILLFVTNIKYGIIVRIATFIFEIGLLPFFLATEAQRLRRVSIINVAVERVGLRKI